MDTFLNKIKYKQDCVASAAGGQVKLVWEHQHAFGLGRETASSLWRSEFQACEKVTPEVVEAAAAAAVEAILQPLTLCQAGFR